MGFVRKCISNKGLIYTELDRCKEVEPKIDPGRILFLLSEVFSGFNLDKFWSEATLVTPLWESVFQLKFTHFYRIKLTII